MTIKQIRKMTGLTQKEFGLCYKVPLSTIKKWESSKSSQNYRECPEYVRLLLERVVEYDVTHKCLPSASKRGNK